MVVQGLFSPGGFPIIYSLAEKGQRGDLGSAFKWFHVYVFSSDKINPFKGYIVILKQSKVSWNVDISGQLDELSRWWWCCY